MVDSRKKIQNLFIIYFFLFLGTVLIGFFGRIFIENYTKNSNKLLLSVNSKKIENNFHYSYSQNPDFFKPFYESATSTKTIEGSVVSAVVPHHLVVGPYLASFFESLKKSQPKPPVVVLFGPNHPQRGSHNVVTSEWSWQTPDGELKNATDLSRELAESNLAELDEKIIATEHSIGALTPFIKHTWPQTELLPIIIKENVSSSTILALAKKLTELLPKGSLVLASVDFSHNQPLEIANWHDELSQDILATATINRLSRAEVDSPKSLELLLNYNRLRGAEQFTLFSHTNSAILAGNPRLPETTSHIIGYFTNGLPKDQPLITLQFFGDIMLDRNVAKAMGDKGLEYIFDRIKGAENRFFNGVDLFVANLEGPFAPTRVPTTKSIAFRFDPVLAPQLKQYNFDVVSLANNHSLDMGWANVDFTEKLVDSVGIAHFGNQIRDTKEYSLLKNVPGTSEQVGFVGLNTTDHPLDLAAVSTTLGSLKKHTKNIVAFLHWGNEYQSHSNSSQQELAHWLIDNGVTAVIGAHPHVVQEVELYKDKPIFYSLGNFIFDQYFSKETQEGLSVGLTIQAGQVKSIAIFPLHSNNSQPQLMRGKQRENFIDWLKKNSSLPRINFPEQSIFNYYL